MNMHKNARTTKHSRVLMIERIEEGWPVRTTALAAGVSVRTVYKWLARYRNEGLSGLIDRSSAAHVRPHALPITWIGLIRTLREARHVAHSIARQLQLARSTVSAVLSRLGWGRLSQLTPSVPVIRYERTAPGELVHLDVKKLGRFHRPGHRVGGEGKSRGAGWEYVHVAIDDYSRFAYAEVLADEKRYTVTRFLIRALREFKRYGIRVARVLTDNGGAYRSRPFRKACRFLDIASRRTRPYRPQTNGKAERFIQTLIRSWAYAIAYATSEHRSQALAPWLRFYNETRPHASLNHHPPISRLCGFGEQRS
jgi:transposase InsO family protein